MAKKPILRHIITGVAVALCTLMVLAAVFPIPASHQLLAIRSDYMVVAQAPEYEVGQEIVDRRSALGKTFYQGDNRYEVALVGLVHYEDGGAWHEIDNAWVTGTAPWDWRMVQDSYHTYALDNFSHGQILKFEHGGSSVAFQPMALQWLSKEGSIEDISMPQSVAASVNNTPRDDIALDMGTTFGNIEWANAYGNGRHFTWTTYPGKLSKVLQLDGPLPSPPQWLLDQGDARARLSFIFAPSSDLDIYVNGSLWDKASKVETIDRIEFRKEGDILWYFNPAEYWATGVDWTPEYVWTNPDTAEGSGWSNPDNAKDGDTVSYARYSVPAQQWSEPLVLSQTETSLVDRVRIYSNGGAQVNAIRVEAYYLDQWVNIYEDTLVKGSWQTYTIPDGEVEVSAVRVSYWNSHSSASRNADCHAVQFWASDLPPDVAGIATTALRKVGSDFYVDVVVSYDWLTKVDYPVYIDPETQVFTSTPTDGEWEVPAGVTEVDVLVVAGGGGAGRGETNTERNPGGGGAGGVRWVTKHSVTPETEVVVTVGAGGAGATTLNVKAVSGYNSVFNTITSIGGGGGGSVSGDARIGGDGGSGGGGAIRGTLYGAGGSGTSGQGHDGATATSSGAGGGGGAGSVGTVTTGGDGSNQSGNVGTDYGVSGVFAKGGDAHSNNAAGAANTGNGGNAAATNSANNGGSGGSGIVIVQYELATDPEISNTPSSYNFGTVSVGGDAATGLDHFTITNTGSIAVDITIQGTDLTGGDDTWTLSDTAAAGENIYGLKAGLDGGDYTIIVKKSATYNTLKSNLAAAATQDWGLKLWMPTSLVGYDNQQMSATVTLVASASS